MGCGSNYLFRLTRGGDQPASSALGKLEIKWRGSLGEVGRLQTQQILGPPLPAKVITTQDRHCSTCMLTTLMVCLLFVITVALHLSLYAHYVHSETRAVLERLSSIDFCLLLLDRTTTCQSIKTSIESTASLPCHHLCLLVQQCDQSY